jgi:hypothetical protein
METIRHYPNAKEHLNLGDTLKLRYKTPLNTQMSDAVRKRLTGFVNNTIYACQVIDLQCVYFINIAKSYNHFTHTIYNVELMISTGELEVLQHNKIGNLKFED